MPVQMITPRRFEDARGWFSETWNADRYAGLGINCAFVQDNLSYSAPAGTLRGLHFQRSPFAQAKLVQCLRGRIYDVAVDLRAASPTYGKWVGVELSAARGNQLFIPPGYAHGFLTLEEGCQVAYKVDQFYNPEADGGVRWDDPDLVIDWPLNGLPIVLSDKDQALPSLREARFEFAYDGVPLRPLEDVG